MGCRYESGHRLNDCGKGLVKFINSNGDSACAFIDYVQVKSKIKASLKGRTLSVTVKPTKGAPAPSGKNLLVVKTIKKTLKVTLADGKGKVKLPKAAKGKKVKIVFKGNDRLKKSTKTITG